MQHVLWQMFDRNLRVDGVDSQRLRDLIRSFQDREKLPVTGTGDSRTRWALDRAWRAAQGRRVGSVLLFAGSPVGPVAFGDRSALETARVYTGLGYSTR